MKIPSANTPTRIAFLFIGSFAARKIGIGMRMIMISDEIFSTALVIRWLVAAEHWAKPGQQMTCFLVTKHSLLLVGTAQYSVKGLHQTPRYKTSMITNPPATYPATILTAKFCFKLILLSMSVFIR